MRKCASCPELSSKTVVAKTSAPLLPSPLKNIRIKRVARHANNMTGKIDDALNLISLNGTIVQAINAHADIDKLQHGVQIVQTDFLLASKLMLFFRVVQSVFAQESQKKVNAAIYIGLLFIVIFVSDVC